MGVATAIDLLVKLVLQVQQAIVAFFGFEPGFPRWSFLGGADIDGAFENASDQGEEAQLLSAGQRRPLQFFQKEMIVQCCPRQGYKMIPPRIVRVTTIFIVNRIALNSDKRYKMASFVQDVRRRLSPNLRASAKNN
jgi:hypothetical protein